VKCTNCSHVQKFHSSLVDSFYSGKSPACPTCVTACENRVALGKRSITCGILRPNIVLYNEFHANGDLIADLQTIDLNKGPDLLIVIGTSLKIVGVKRLIKDFAEAVHSREGIRIVILGYFYCNIRLFVSYLTRPGRICIFLNMTPAPKEFENIFDYQVPTVSLTIDDWSLR
jgi:NAD-dependent SIR2 family protein deacetylase